MKRSIYIFVVLLFICCSLFSSCNFTKDFMNMEKNVNTIMIKGIELKQSSIIFDGCLVEYNIKYPYLNDYSDEHISKINQQIYNYVIPSDAFIYKDYRENIEISYSVTFASDQLLSIFFFGEHDAMGSYADYKRAITIDLNSGDILSLRDFFMVAEVQTIISDLFETDKCEVFDKIFDDTESKKRLKPIYLEDFKDDSALSQTDNFYIKNDKICLIGSSYPSMRQNTMAEFNVGETPRVRVNN